MSDSVTDEVRVAGAPAIPGLTFRQVRVPDDLAAIAAGYNAAYEADNFAHRESADDIASFFGWIKNSDPLRDRVIAEVDGEMAGFTTGWWRSEVGGPLAYQIGGFVVPRWRRRGLGRALLRWVEGRMRAVAAGHDPAREKVHQAYVAEGETGFRILLEQEGYRPVRYYYQMVRPTLDDIPDFPLPEGLEVRPVTPDDYRAIWEADREAFRDHYGFSEPQPGAFESWQTDPVMFQPQLWQVAWDVATNEVAGQVRTFINHGENEQMNRKRGYTEFISVRRPWRRRGLARALIALSLRAQRDEGMTESALGVDSENQSGATRIYEDCGFRTAETSASYRKPLEERHAD